MRVFYKFDYKGLENVPYGKPVVLAPNHVNAFIDPVIVGMVMRNKVRFFARGDVFKKGLVKWVLNSLNISPMYRIQEGYSELKKNDKSLEECRRLLGADKTILLFPEAICVQEKQLRPLKKGLSRIVFQTEELFDFKKDVVIIPVGLNYFNATKFRSKLFIDYGEPISLQAYEQKYKQDKVKTINEFTKDLEQKMAERMVIVKTRENEKLLEGIEEIYLYQWLKDKEQNYHHIEHIYYGSKEIGQMINWLEDIDAQAVVSLRKKIITYTNQLRENKLRDHLLRPENVEKINIGSFILEYFTVCFGMLLYGIALLTNYPPYVAAKGFCDKKIKNIEFYASVYANLAMIFWLLFYGIQLLAIALVFRNWQLLSIYAFIVPLLGLYSLWFYPIKQKIFGRWRLLRMVRKERKTVEDLIHQRNSIVADIEKIKADYLSVIK